MAFCTPPPPTARVGAVPFPALTLRELPYLRFLLALATWLAIASIKGGERQS